MRSVIPKNITCIYIRQSEPLGLGHAVLCARPVVGNEPFAVLLADDFMDTAPADKPVLAQMTELYDYENCSILAVQDVPRENTRQYGIVSAAPYRPGIELVSGIVEKPQPDVAPSTLAVVGRYVLTGRIFDYLENLGTGAGGEIQLTDGIAALMEAERVLAYRYAGQRYDCGSKLGYLKAMTAMGLEASRNRRGIAPVPRPTVRRTGRKMTVREILKMGDPRLLRVAEPVREFDTPELHALIADMFDTMHAANGAGLAAPQIGVNLQLVIYGFKQNARYPDAPQVPETVLINPVLTPLSDEMDEALRRLPVGAGPARRWCRASAACATRASTSSATRSRATSTASTRAWCSTRSITCWASCTRCGSPIFRSSATPK